MPSSVKLIGDPILRTKCAPLSDFTGLDELLHDMHETMKAERGIGLAANQIGLPIRVFIMKKDDSYREFINPEIINKEELVDFEGEGCLSIPGASATTKRYRKVELKWTAKDGTTQSEVFENMEAFAVQHEIDHLDGKLYVDQFGPVKKEMVVKKHKKFLKLTRR